MNQRQYQLATEAETERFGATLAQHLPPAAVVALDGELGAGKTRLVQAIAVALGIPREQVVSPTFVLVKQYGTPPILHIDAYRLRDDDEFYELGPDEMFHSARVTLIEWATRVVDCLPTNRLNLHLVATAENTRQVIVTAQDDEFLPLIEILDQSFAG